MIATHPKEIMGPWDQGYVLDVHTISSTMIGYNEFGHAEFDTLRSQLGEMVYRLKYRGDRGAVEPVAETISDFVKNWGVRLDAVVPVPPSKQRSFQPVVEIAGELARSMNLSLNTDSLKKVKPTQQMKDLGDFGARVAALEEAFACDAALAGKAILLIDDLFQSGATMSVAARTLKGQGRVASVYALALTRTRS
jgi:predicted amidophosphoribosyltransferase